MHVYNINLPGIPAFKKINVSIDLQEEIGDTSWPGERQKIKFTLN